MSQRFSYGENWKDYVDNDLDEERISTAKDSLREFYGLDDFSEKTFLDVGSGSGLFSYCAYELGAEKVVSFDIDEHSVECTKHMRERAGGPGPDDWAVLKGNVLDEDFINLLGKFDLVYSWGVLMTTGNMEKAIDNTKKAVADGGMMYIAIYNRPDPDEYKLSAEDWHRVKEIYNERGSVARHVMEAGYIGYWSLSQLRMGKNPLTEIRRYGRGKRGMAFYRDVKDWLGGLPYEYGTPEEINKIVEDDDFELVKLEDVSATGCNEYVYKKLPQNINE
jgi:SAM-dependent methyltransferase